MPQRSILITGCSSGIGAFCARALLADGWQVFATARKTEDLQALSKDGVNAIYLDYREPESLASAVDAISKKTGGQLDALFNNGAYAQAGAVEDLPTDALREQFETNVFGWHELTRLVVPMMRNQGHGRIVHCSSVLGVAPWRFRGAYAASKFALEGLMLCQKLELAGTGIHVSLIEPGPIRSKIGLNAQPYFSKYIDTDASPHRKDYEYQLSRLEGKNKNRFRLEPDAVYKALDHALNAKRPKTHYPVTLPAKFVFWVKRVLPLSLYYALLAKQE